MRQCGGEARLVRRLRLLEGYLRSPFELWTGSWTVPDDAPTGTISYTVTATDRFGRTATFTPFSAQASQLVIVP